MLHKKHPQPACWDKCGAPVAARLGTEFVFLAPNICDAGDDSFVVAGYAVHEEIQEWYQSLQVLLPEVPLPAPIANGGGPDIEKKASKYIRLVPWVDCVLQKGKGEG